MRYLNPGEYLIPKLLKGFLKEAEDAFQRFESIPIQQANSAEDLERAFNDAALSGEPMDPKTTRVRIPKSMLSKALFFQEALMNLSLAFARTYQPELLKASLVAYCNCFAKYCENRAEYFESTDDIAASVSDDLSDLRRAISGSSETQLVRIFWRFVQTTCTATLSITAPGKKTARHNVALPIITAAHEYLIEDIVNRRNESAFEGIKALGYIGEYYARSRNMASAEGVAQKLEQYAQLGRSTQSGILITTARRSIAAITYFMLAGRRSFYSFDVPYNSILEIYQREFPAASPIPAGTYLDPISWYDPDTLKDLSAASLVRGALFPAFDDCEDTHNHIVAANLDAAQRVLTILSGPSENTMALMLEYQALLYLIAFVFEDVTQDIVGYYISYQFPSPANRELAIGILQDRLNLIIEKLSLKWTGQKTQSTDEDEALHILFSTFSIIAHLEAKTPNGRGTILRSPVRKLANAFKDAVTGLQGDDTHYLRLKALGSYLATSCEHKSLGRLLLRTAKDCHVARGANNLNRHRWNQIARPILSFRPDFYQNVDSAVFEGHTR